MATGWLKQSTVIPHLQRADCQPCQQSLISDYRSKSYKQDHDPKNQPTALGDSQDTGSDFIRTH